MTNPVSLPQELPQPTTAEYGLTALYLFTLYPTRDAYRAAFSAEPPPYDPAKPSKSWFDTSAGAGSYQYYGADDLSHSFTMTPADAAAVNLWGDTEYPRYEPAATPALYLGLETEGGFIDQAPLPPAMLSTRDQANALATTWGLPVSAVSDQSTAQMMNRNGETRGIWMIDVNGSPYCVGQKIAESMANGVGAPGHWQGQTWVSDVPALPASANPEGPIPMRLLKPNEQFTTGGMMDPGSYIELIPAAPATPAVAGGGLTDAQAQQLQRIEDGVNAIAQRFGIS